MEFEQLEYSVEEDEEVVHVCVELLGGTLGQPGSVTVHTQPGTATGEGIQKLILNKVCVIGS